MIEQAPGAPPRLRIACPALYSVARSTSVDQSHSRSSLADCLWQNDRERRGAGPRMARDFEGADGAVQERRRWSNQPPNSPLCACPKWGQQPPLARWADPPSGLLCRARTLATSASGLSICVLDGVLNLAGIPGQAFGIVFWLVDARQLYRRCWQDFDCAVGTLSDRVQSDARWRAMWTCSVRCMCICVLRVSMSGESRSSDIRGCFPSRFVRRFV